MELVPTPNTHGVWAPHWGVPHMNPVPSLSTWGDVPSPPDFLQVKVSAFGREMLLSFNSVRVGQTP